jgi:hypothetical protein
MECERYKKALIEVAAGGELPRAVRSHVDGCAECRGTLAAEEVLFAAIDRSVRQRANVELPTQFASRVMARVADEPVPQPRWSLAWAAVAASAVLSITLGLAWNLRHRTAVGDGERPTVARQSFPSTNESASAPGTTANAASLTRARHFARRRSHEAKFEVLVSADARAATDEFIENLRRGQIDGKALVSEAHKPLEIAPIVIAPLASLSRESDSDNPDMSGLPVNNGFSQDTNRRTK